MNESLVLLQQIAKDLQGIKSELIDLRLSQDIFFDYSIESNYISINEIAQVFDKSHQAVSKRLQKYLPPNEIVKVRGLNSIHRKHLKKLGYQYTNGGLDESSNRKNYSLR